MKRYSDYQSSKIDWIGEIPSSWIVIPFKRLTQVKRGASPRPIDDQKYFDENGEFGWVRIADVTASERYLQTTTQKLSELGASLSVKRYPGDLFLSIAGTVGKPIISKIKCCIHDGFVWFPDLKIDPEFLYYIFSAGLAYQGLGKMGTQLNLNTETVGYINLPLPSRAEICHIVKYLDEATEKIDDLISQKQKLIDLLKEENLAIINQAVTKGIDSSVEMKDSGIEWLGKIPNHWELRKLKYVAIINPTKSQSKIDKHINSLITFLPMENVSEDGNINCEIKKSLMELSKGFTYFEKNDVILAKITPCFENGKGALLDDLDTGIGFGSTEFHVIRVKENILIKEFLYFITKTNIFMNMGEALMIGSAGQKRVPTSFLENYLIPFPQNKDEQQAIIKYINFESKNIQTTISKIQKEIDLLQEYRTVLISEVVTGKIDVRDEVASWT